MGGGGGERKAPSQQLFMLQLVLSDMWQHSRIERYVKRGDGYKDFIVLSLQVNLQQAEAVRRVSFERLQRILLARRRAKSVATLLAHHVS